MSAKEMTDQPLLFTVGHSNHTLETFIDLLQKHGIQFLVDVRSHPYSKYVPHFNKEVLPTALNQAGIKYLFLGKELGGQPEAEDCYDEKGYVLYHRLANSPLFLVGIARLEKGVRQYTIGIMCGEEDPAGCHRHLLVGRVMAQRGVRVRHIRGDGQLQTDADLQPEEVVQPLLFALDPEDTWKSVRVVSPRKQKDYSASALEMETSD